MTRHTSPGPAFLDALSARLGPGRVSSDASDLAGHLVEERKLYRGQALALVRPRTTEEVSAVAAECNRAGVPLVVHSGNTGLVGGGVPFGGIVLSTERLDRVRELDAVNATITVEAGCILKSVNDAANAADLTFPLSLPSEGSCRIGGNLGTNAGGTGVLRYGNARDLVLGLEVVLADGRVWNGLNGLRKDNSGYDLKHLFVGSEGTLGIITELTLRLRPIPEAISAAICSFPTTHAAVATAIAIVQAGVPVARCELLDATSMRAVNAHAQLDHAEAPTLFLEFHGSPAGVEEDARYVEELARAHSGDDFTWATRQEDRSRLWRARHNAYFAGIGLRPGCRALTTDVCVPVSELAAAIDATVADVAGLPFPAPLLGHVADGNFHVMLLIDPDDAEDRRLAEGVYDRIVDRAIAAGGTCTGEHGVGLGKRRALGAQSGDAVEVMRALKHALDPSDCLNPGKVLPQLEAHSNT
jgi:D-lactate dehydrogenase (cytochrome)